MATEQEKKRLQKKAGERYQVLLEEKIKKQTYGCKQYKNFPEEEKEKKHQYEQQCYKNLSEDQKQRIAEYKKIII